jgi:hypothetical protein
MPGTQQHETPLDSVGFFSLAGLLPNGTFLFIIIQALPVPFPGSCQRL